LNPQIFLFSKLPPSERKKILKRNNWAKEINAIAGCFKSKIIFFNFYDMYMISFKEILQIVNHEYMHYILWRLESEKTCEKLDNLINFPNKMDLY